MPDYPTLEDIWKEAEPYAIRDGLTFPEFVAEAKKDYWTLHAGLQDCWLFYRYELEEATEDELLAAQGKTSSCIRCQH